MKKVLIIGAGAAGLSAARILIESGYEVEIFELDSKVGGLSKSFSLFNQIVDVGPHRFFSKDSRINDFWLAHTNNTHKQVGRLTRIFYNKKFFYYPLRGFDALFKLGFIESSLCVLSYIKAKLFPFRGNSFESWVANAFGYRLYHIFFKTYTQKLWGIPCDKLDADFAAQRIKGLNLYEAIKSAFFGDKNKKHKTLVDEFSYPDLGAGVVYKNIATEILQRGGKIHYNTKVLGLLTQNKKAKGITIQNQSCPHSQTQILESSTKPTTKEIWGDIIISTAPFSDMVLSLDELDSEILALVQELRFRNTILVYIEVDCGEIFADNWIYVHSPNTATGRITNFSNWTSGLKCGQDSSILCLEYWANDEEALWNLDEEALIEIAKKDLIESNLVQKEQILRGFVLKIHKSYPVYTQGYKEGLHRIYKALDEFRNLYFIGRNGSFKYNNQDHSILMGLMCADKILGASGINLWHINTDYEYQEESK